ncbi:acyl-CoA dehydrogenase family protein [Blastococcus sp. SYSU D00820]
MTEEKSHNPEVAALVERVDAIRPLLLQNGVRGEQERTIPAESYQALVEAGVFRLSVPTRFGGYAGNSRDSVAVARAIGRGDGGAAWVFGILNSGSWVSALLPLQAQEELWSETPDTPISIVLAASSTAVKVDGGFRITGKWAYGTGSNHAEWSLLGFPIVDDQGTVVDQGLALIPTSDLKTEDTWYVAGMKSTGSNTQVADDVFVPEHRVLPLTAAVEGTYPASGLHPEISYKPVFVPALFLQLVGPHLGMGRAVLDKVISSADKKAIAYTTYERQSDAVSFQLAVAKATLLLETAEVFAYRIADDLYASAERGEYYPYPRRIQMRAEAGYAVECVTQAIDALVSAHGSAAFAEASLIQRFWRDQATAARHGHSLPASGYEAFGKVLLDRVDEARGMLPVV